MTPEVSKRTTLEVARRLYSRGLFSVRLAMNGWPFGEREGGGEKEGGRKME